MEEHASTPERQAILDVMRDIGQPVTAKELANRLEKNLYTMRNLLAALRKEEKISLHNNTYSLVTPSEASYPGDRSDPSEVSLAPVPLTRPHYAGTQTHSYPLEELDKPDESTSEGSLTRVTTITTDMETMNREIAEKLYRDLQQVARFQEYPHRWQVAGSQFIPAPSIPFDEYTRRIRACIDAGGARLDAVLPELRQKLARVNVP